MTISPFSLSNDPSPLLPSSILEDLKCGFLHRRRCSLPLAGHITNSSSLSPFIALEFHPRYNFRVKEEGRGEREGQLHCRLSIGELGFHADFNLGVT